MRIVKADISNAEELLALQKAAFHIEGVRYNDFSIQPLIETIDDYSKDFYSQTYLAMVDKGEIVGSVAVRKEGDTAYIGRLVVLPERQGEGVASALLAEAEMFFPVKRFELFTGHRSEKNVSIYRSKGYREFKRKQISDTVTFIYMEKENI